MAFDDDDGYGDEPDEEWIEAFAIPPALERFFGVDEGDEGFRWRTVIDGEAGGLPIFKEQGFRFKHGGWTWKDYYKEVRDFVKETFKDDSPSNARILSMLPRR